MIEAIGVIRDITIILSAIVITGIMLVVGRAVLRLIWSIEVASGIAIDLVGSIASPIKRLLLLFGHHARH